MTMTLSEAAVKKDIEISLDHRRIHDVSTSGLTLVFYLRISNSSSATYSLTKYEFRAVVHQTEYVRLQTALEEPIAVLKNADTLISLPLKITYSLLFKSVQGIAIEEKVPCYVMGTMFFSGEKKRDEKVPFAFSGEFPIFKGLDIVFRPLLIRNLTIGGADLSFEFALRNTNGFDMGIERVAYVLDFGNIRIRESEIKEEHTIAKGGEKIFSFPLLLEFFEIGRELYDILGQPAVACRLSGEVDILTSWGGMRIPFSVSEDVATARQ